MKDMIKVSKIAGTELETNCKGIEGCRCPHYCKRDRIEA